MSIPESKVRYIVAELAKDIIELDTILNFAQLSKQEYLELSQTRAFKDALSIAQTEWQGATNTPKRTKLKAAAIAEELLLLVFYDARDKKDESLSAKTKALETIAKIAGLGALEPAAPNGGMLGNIFNLEIHYTAGKQEDQSFQIGAPYIEGEFTKSEPLEDEDYPQSNQDGSEGLANISEVFSDEAFEEL